MSKNIGPTRQQKMLRVQPCEDPTSKEYRQHRFVQWGDDERYQRCDRCGTINAEGISSEAKYPLARLLERPVKHHHTFEPSRLDVRYEVCFCGASRRLHAPTVDGVNVVDAPIVVVHCRKDAFDLYVGRPMPRFPDLRAIGFGNPFTVRNLPKGYDSPIDAYRDWQLGKPACSSLAGFRPELRASTLARLPELRGMVLGCWCAPKGGIPGNLYGKTCHGEVLAALADHSNDVRFGGAA